MTRFVYALLLGLVGAGIVHIAIVLAIPLYSERDAWSRVSELTGSNSFVRLARGGAGDALMRSADPLLETAACQFDLSDGPVRATFEGAVPFWSLSVFDRRGQSRFSLNDRTSTGGALDVVIVTPAQLIELRKAMPAEFERSVFIEADIDLGMLVVRTLVPDATWRPAVEAWFGTSTCSNV